jgi:RimJ/RimL family protein N-acetyltransferase
VIAVFETPRLRLRTWSPSPHDAEFLLRLYGDPAVMRHLGAPPWTSLDRAHLAIERATAQQSERGHCIWAVERRDEASLLGACGLYHVEHEQVTEVAYHFIPLAWGHGYATEALRATLAYAHTALGLARVVGAAVPENTASRRVMEKAGMISLGIGAFDGEAGLALYESTSG